jgi:hypothetical protein
MTDLSTVKHEDEEEKGKDKDIPVTDHVGL